MQKKTGKIIALLGGTFDPPTYGHMLLCCECLNLKLADEIWMIPSGIRTDKKTQTPPYHRLKMLELFLEDFKHQNQQFTNIINNIKINNIEIENHNTIKTYYLLQQLQEKYQQNHFKWILGSDLINTLDKWTEGDKLKQSTDFIVFHRPGFDLDPKLAPKHYTLIDGFQTNISSTMVRQRFQNSNNNSNRYQLMGILPHNLVQYIIDNKLYQNESKL